MRFIPYNNISFLFAQEGQEVSSFWCASDTSAVKTKNFKIVRRSSLLLGREFNLEFIWLYECAVCSSQLELGAWNVNWDPSTLQWIWLSTKILKLHNFVRLHSTLFWIRDHLSFNNKDSFALSSADILGFRKIPDLRFDLFLSTLLVSRERRNFTSNGLGWVLLSLNFPRR